MNRKCHTSISRRLRPLALAVACALAGPVFAQNLPGGFTNVQGVDTPTTVGNTMTVTQTTQRGIAEWQSFSIGNGYSVIFNQPGSSSVLLNRVVGNDSSKIAGNLSANGQIYLINPNGVLFSQGSSVNVGGLVASTLNISNNDFLTGGALKFSRADNNDAAVTNEGSITATDGSIALMAARVTNSGTLSASGGTVGLVSARTVNVDFDGDGLTTFTIPDDSLASAAWVENSGQVDADGGRIVLLAASTVREQVVKQSGTLRARSLSNRGGEIVLGGDTSSGNEVLVGGEIDVSGNDAGVAGGTVSVEASTVLVDGARINASGVGQGGRVAVNGGNVGLFNGSIDASGTVQGGNIDVRAKTDPNQGDNGIIAMDKDFSLHADATGSQGNGGQIILLADAVTRAHGVLTARAGRQGGDGGLIETSGGVLELSGILVDASAPAGKAGEWLLDPYDIYIENGGGSGFSLPSNPFISTTDSTTVYDGDINYNLNRGTSVTIRTGGGGSQAGNIRLAPDIAILKSSGGNATLTLDAHNRIYTLDVPSGSIRSTAGALNVVFNARGDGVYLNDFDITTNGGYVTINSPGAIFFVRDNINAGSGSITLAGAGISAYIQGGSVYIYDTTISGGRIDITGSSNIYPGVYIEAESTIKGTGDVILRARSESTYSNAFRIDGQVSAGGVLNLRPGGVDANGVAFDRPDDAILIGDLYSSGAFMYAADFANLTASTIVVGSSTHNGTITVDAPITASSALTLQNGGGGIMLDASVSAPTLGLVSAGLILQKFSVITANNLFAHSSGDGVSLPGDLSSSVGNFVGTLSGGAGDSFAFTNTPLLTIGPVSVTGYDGASNKSQSISTGTLIAHSVYVSTYTGDLTLAMPVSSTSTVLDVGGRFQNPGTGSISGPWIVWAKTWVGETRGGMAGTADNLPNIYGCPMPGDPSTPCASGVVLPKTGNHFIYAEQPTTTVTVNDATRFVGMDYLPLSFKVDNLIFAADRSSFTASFSTSVTALSPVGDYPIQMMTVVSGAGYLITGIRNNPATLHVIPEPVIAKPSAPEAVVNYAFMPVCLRTDEFDSAFKAVLDSDALTHEWSRLRSRPRISSCLGVSDQRKGCADF